MSSEDSLKALTAKQAKVAAHYAGIERDDIFGLDTDAVKAITMVNGEVRLPIIKVKSGRKILRLGLNSSNVYDSKDKFVGVFRDLDADGNLSFSVFSIVDPDEHQATLTREVAELKAAAKDKRSVIKMNY